MQNLLLESFDYDLWANRRWFEFLPHATPDESAIFAHILKAQKIWVDRINGKSATAFPDLEPTPQVIEDLYQNWIEVLKTRNLDEVIKYKRITGEANALQINQIARQVANHGTYHRGHLRGLCQARNCTDFPETDILIFFLEK